jgi:hypothetical protein
MANSGNGVLKVFLQTQSRNFMNKICRLLSQHLSERAEVGHEEFRTFLSRGI